MNVSVPALAPGVEPVQGASRKWILLAPSFSPIAREAEGPMVLASATTVPGLAPSMTPLGPSNTCSAMAVSPTQRQINSDFSATSFGERQAIPFSSATNCLTFDDVCDQTATLCAARARFRAIA